MSIQKTLQEHRDAIANDWISAIYGTYDFDTVGFLRSQENQFSNPVGTKTKKAVGMLLDALFGDGLDADIVNPAMDELIRIRAVQKFTPEAGLAVVFFLKTIIRKHLKSSLTTVAEYKELQDIEGKIDSIALVGFRIFVDCREQIQRMRVDEVKRKHSQLLRRAERILENPVGEPDK